MVKTHILIVDDSAFFRQTNRKILSAIDADITEASDGQQALEIVKSGDFDLIISDVDMPRMNGIELCKRLKENPKTERIPLAMLSMFDSEENISMGFEAGASLYLSKNSANDEILAAVKELLSKSEFRSERIIMVVDDQTTILRIVEQGLKQAGFQVVTAENGKQALALLEKQKPDLVLSDLNMPEMDGFTFLDILRTEPHFASIPFVVMSSANDRATMLKMLQRGAVSFIAKPFNINQLVFDIDKFLSDQFTFMLKEKQRLESENQLFLASIASLVTALEARDGYTRGHSESVARILTGMVELSGGTKRDIERAMIAGRLHDIGKIGIHDKVLKKTGPLSDDEYSHIKQHPVIGAFILKSHQDMEDIIEVVLCHHERFDGKGYPNGLRGKAIPLWARMAAVADTYDALTSDRPYRKRLEQEKAIKIIEEVRGTQLCPESVEFFMQWIGPQKAEVLNERDLVIEAKEVGLIK